MPNVCSIPGSSTNGIGGCQRWRHRRHTWQDGRELIDPSRYQVAPVAEADAKQFVVDHHYSGTYPAARLRYGLHDVADDGRLVGVAVLSVPVQAKVLTGPFASLEPYTQSLELGRFVLLDHVPANGETWFMARAFRMAHEAGVRGVVSFSDPVPRWATIDEQDVLVMPGHVGTIYQAANAIYAGRGTARRITMLPDGRTLNDRAKSKVRNLESGHAHVERLLVSHGAKARKPSQDPASWLTQALADTAARSIAHAGNHRYLFALGGTAQARKLRRDLGCDGAYPKAVDVP